MVTLPETTTADPEIQWLEDDARPEITGELLVSGRVTGSNMCWRILWKIWNPPPLKIPPPPFRESYHQIMEVQTSRNKGSIYLREY